MLYIFYGSTRSLRGILPPQFFYGLNCICISQPSLPIYIYINYKCLPMYIYIYRKAPRGVRYLLTISLPIGIDSSNHVPSTILLNLAFTNKKINQLTKCGGENPIPREVRGAVMILRDLNAEITLATHLNRKVCYIVGLELMSSFKCPNRATDIARQHLDSIR